MKNIKIGEVLQNRPLSTIVVCKEQNYKDTYRMATTCKYGFDVEPRPFNISEEEKSLIEGLAKTNPSQAIESLLKHTVGDDLITSYAEGTSYLLPQRFRRFYERTVSIEFIGGTIYFTDYAIERFKSLIEFFKEQAFTDTVRFSIDKINSGKAKHLHISVSDDLSFKKSRYVFLDDDLDIRINPPDSLFFHTSTSLSDRDKEVEDIETLLRAYTSKYGLFNFTKWNDSEIVAYNENSMKIVGLDKNNKIFKKVMEFHK